MPKPLPVDVTSTWWDYFVDGVGVVSGLATAGALVVAAFTYRRQVEEASRKQASLVQITTVRWRFDGPTDGDDCLAVENGSDQSIRVTAVYIDPDSIGDCVLIDHKFPTRLLRDTFINLAKKESAEPGWPQAIVDFTDANRRTWRLAADNTLLRLTRLDRLREQVEDWVTPEHRRQSLWGRRIARGVR